MISREIGWSNQNNLTFGIIKQVNKIQKDVCCNCNISTTTTTSTSSSSTTTTTTTTIPIGPFNFDVTANWSLATPNVIDAATFKTFLESGQDGDGNTNNLTGIVITDFLLVGNRLRCNVSSTGGSDLAFSFMGVTDVTSFGNLQAIYLYLSGNNISSVDNTSWPINVNDIDLGNNSITSFDNVTWPNTLDYLGLYDNAIISFNPVTPLPSGITQIDLSNTFITSVDNVVWPSDLQTLNLTSNQIITFDPSVALPSGLIYIGLQDNQIVTFNPSIALPSGLQTLGLNSNQMTTAGYTASEPWANAMSVIPGRGTIDFSGNPNLSIGTNLETILIAKGWNVFP
jgi:hypothetical protein